MFGKVLNSIGLLVLLVGLASASYGSDKIRVAFINPDKVGNPFWDNVTLFMQAVANDLDIHLQVHYANINRFQATRLAKTLVQSPQKPDYLVYIYYVGQGDDMLRIAEAGKVRSFIFNTDVPIKDQKVVGTPREKFSYWIGHMRPDDVQAGFDLASHLIKVARENEKHSADGTIQMVGVSGGRDSTAALDRNQGLQRALRINKGVKLRQLVFANWDRAVAFKKASLLLGRYPEYSLVWTASDSMALGAIEGIQAKGKIAGKDIFLGVIDWTEQGLKAVEEGKLVATMGGHFMEGGWSLVLIHDYHHGIDFASSGTTIRSKLQAITQKNVQSYRHQLGDQNWETIDFRQFSKVLNPKLQTYDFSLTALLDSSRNPDTSGLLAP